MSAVWVKLWESPGWISLLRILKSVFSGGVFSISSWGVGMSIMLSLPVVWQRIPSFARMADTELLVIIFMSGNFSTILLISGM